TLTLTFRIPHSACALPQRDYLHRLQLLPEEPRPDLPEVRLVVRNDEAMRGILSTGRAEAALLDLPLHGSGRLLCAIDEAHGRAQHPAAHGFETRVVRAPEHQ